MSDQAMSDPTERTLYKETEDEKTFGDRIFIVGKERVGIGISAGGPVNVMPLREWSRLAENLYQANHRIQTLQATNGDLTDRLDKAKEQIINLQEIRDFFMADATKFHDENLELKRLGDQMAKLLDAIPSEDLTIDDIHLIDAWRQFRESK